MRYLGGKSKIARHVVDVIERYRAPAQPVWEPFCGGLNVTRELARRGIDVIATDAGTLQRAAPAVTCTTGHHGAAQRSPTALRSTHHSLHLPAGSLPATVMRPPAQR